MKSWAERVRRWFGGPVDSELPVILERRNADMEEPAGNDKVEPDHDEPVWITLRRYSGDNFPTVKPAELGVGPILPKSRVTIEAVVSSEDGIERTLSGNVNDKGNRLYLTHGWQEGDLGDPWPEGFACTPTSVVVEPPNRLEPTPRGLGSARRPRAKAGSTRRTRAKCKPRCRALTDAPSPPTLQDHAPPRFRAPTAIAGARE
jgi:hypothetical protein